MKSLTLLVSAALAVQKLSVMTWIWGRKTILWMNSSAAEKLCGFSGILWYPVDIWSILSLLQHLSKGSIFLTVLPSNSLPDMSFSCLLTPACSVSPQDLCCRGAAEDKEVISATVSVRVSSAPASLAVLRESPWRSVWKSGKSGIGVSPCSITTYTKHWHCWFFCTISPARFPGWWLCKCGLSWSWKLTNIPGAAVGIYQTSQEEK